MTRAKLQSSTHGSGSSTNRSGSSTNGAGAARAKAWPLAALLWLLCPLTAHADCTLDVVGLNFGDYDPFSSQDIDITASIAVSCDVESSYEIALSTGFGSYTARLLTNGPNLLSYNLFVDPTRLTVWGDGSPGTSTVSSQSVSADLPVYGRIPAGQNAHLGSYGDSVTITITF